MINKFNSQSADEKRLILNENKYWCSFYETFKQEEFTNREDILKRILMAYDSNITNTKTILIEKINFTNGDELDTSILKSLFNSYG